MKYKRIYLIVLDSVGIGNAKDALEFGDEGSHTLQSIAKASQGLNVPTLEKLGLGHIGEFEGIDQKNNFKGVVTRLNELSLGKDTMTGHWEMMGLEITEPFMTFTETGFPKEFIEAFEQHTGRKCVGNYAESGTKILDDWGEHHQKTGDWIVYTSADSVFQVAANEAVVPLDELYAACEFARELAMDEKWKVGRIIARPFVGERVGEYKRTPNRHDWALKPFGKTVLNSLADNNIEVIGIGKIPDIFVNEGITKAIKSVSNEDGMNKTIELLNQDFTGLAFLNLVDFDAVYGHRRDPIGYGKAIEEFDLQLATFINHMQETDLVMITADHGNDPCFKGTDHTREQVPLIMYSPSMTTSKILEEQPNFGVIGATIAENFNVENPGIGDSVLGDL